MAGEAWVATERLGRTVIPACDAACSVVFVDLPIDARLAVNLACIGIRPMFARGPPGFLGS
jgi:hypothetical protein